MQPRLGQLPGQGGPSGLSVMWPSSAPRPCAPRKVIPPITTPPPTPVPSVSITRWSSPSRCASASAAQLASLSTNTGTPKRRPSSSRSGTPVSGMFTLVSTVPVAYSIWEGTPTPIASGWPTRSIMRFTAASIPSSSASVLCRDGGVLDGLTDGHAVDRRDGDLRAAYVDAEDHDRDSYPRGAQQASAVTWHSPTLDVREPGDRGPCGQEWGT